jgi:DNA-binding GntR family transcriptional regulator
MLVTSQPSTDLVAGIRSVPEAIYLSVRDAILNGTYRPGSALRQELLAQHFNVSRVPVREALNRLEAEGLVVLRPRKGYVVASLDLDEIVEIFQMRMVLEEHAGYVATVSRTETDVQEIRRILESMENVPVESPDGIAEWTALNRTFHARLFASSRRKHLCHVAGTFRDMVERYVRIEVAMTGHLGEAQAEHHEIVEAFAKGQAERVGRLSREHCEHTANRLIGALRARERQGTGSDDDPPAIDQG